MLPLIVASFSSSVMFFVTLCGIHGSHVLRRPSSSLPALILAEKTCIASSVLFLHFSSFQSRATDSSSLLSAAAAAREGNIRKPGAELLRSTPVAERRFKSRSGNAQRVLQSGAQIAQRQIRSAVVPVHLCWAANTSVAPAALVLKSSKHDIMSAS